MSAPDGFHAKRFRVASAGTGRRIRAICPFAKNLATALLPQCGCREESGFTWPHADALLPVAWTSWVVLEEHRSSEVAQRCVPANIQI
jgi:hypothetical protein